MAENNQEANPKPEENTRASRKRKFNPVKEMEHLNPEPDYIIKTRPPMWDDWRLNVVRGVKENEIAMEAAKIARRKCWETGDSFAECTQREGTGRERKCKKEFQKFVNCCHWE